MNTAQPIIYTQTDVKEQNNSITINQINSIATVFASQEIQTNIDPIMDLNVKKLN